MPCCISARPPKIGAADPAVRNARETLVAALFTAADNEITAQAPGAGHPSASTRPQASTAARRDWMCCAAASANCSRQPEAAAAAATGGSRLHRSRQPEAAPAAAAKRRKGRRRWFAEATLQRIGKVDPIYPQRALEQLVSGWVELQFTVASDGTVQDVVVMDSQPRVTFDKSAMAALRRWRYQPVMRDGIAVPQRAHVRMRFTAMDQKR